MHNSKKEELEQLLTENNPIEVTIVYSTVIKSS